MFCKLSHTPTLYTHFIVTLNVDLLCKTFRSVDGHFNQNIHKHVFLRWIDECDAKLSYIRCDRCTEVVHKDLYDIHSMEDYCTDMVDPKAAKCPLCHSNVTGIDEGGWPKHLLSPGACAGNIRRRSKQ